ACRANLAPKLGSHSAENCIENDGLYNNNKAVASTKNDVNKDSGFAKDAFLKARETTPPTKGNTIKYNSDIAIQYGRSL
ncbi:MAG: hypothetical protein ACOVNR_05290, partial [Chitinophagaceae bacterium]